MSSFILNQVAICKGDVFFTVHWTIRNQKLGVSSNQRFSGFFMYGIFCVGDSICTKLHYVRQTICFKMMLISFVHAQLYRSLRAVNWVSCFLLWSLLLQSFALSWLGSLWKWSLNVIEVFLVKNISPKQSTKSHAEEM